MNFTSLFIRRPVMTTLVMVGILVFGITAYRQLPVSDLPNVDFPTITVNASLPGASPETMAASVATPLEKQFSTIAGIDNMTSSSTLGSTQVTLQFSLERNVDAAAQDVQAAISATLRQLPQGITPPSYQKVNPANSPILFVALSSSTLPMADLDEIAETQLAQRVSTVNGVAQVVVYGTQKRAVHVQMDPRRMARLQLGTSDVANAISTGNPNVPSGTLWGTLKSKESWAGISSASANESGKSMQTSGLISWTSISRSSAKRCKRQPRPTGSRNTQASSLCAERPSGNGMTLVRVYSPPGYSTSGSVPKSSASSRNHSLRGMPMYFSNSA